MPTIEYKCQQCGHTFQRVILQGETPKPVECPKCRARLTMPLSAAESLFPGGNSSLLADRN